MCVHTDLFGDIIVTVNDVDNWLNSQARMLGRSQSSREQYAKYYDVANKIKLSKSSGQFYLLMDELKSSIHADSQPIQLFKTVYVSDIEDAKNAPCPTGLHICEVLTCAFYRKRLNKAKASDAWYARKARDRKEAKTALNRF